MKIAKAAAIILAALLLITYLQFNIARRDADRQAQRFGYVCDAYDAPYRSPQERCDDAIRIYP